MQARSICRPIYVHTYIYYIRKPAYFARVYTHAMHVCTFVYTHTCIHVAMCWRINRTFAFPASTVVPLYVPSLPGVTHCVQETFADLPCFFFVFRSSNPRTYSTCTANLCRNIRTWSERTFLRWWCCCDRTASRETADTERGTCWLSYRLSTTTRRFNNLQFLLSPGHHRHSWFLLIRTTVTYIFIGIILFVVLARFVHCKVSFSPFWTSYSKKRIKRRCTDVKYPFSWWTRLNSE